MGATMMKFLAILGHDEQEDKDAPYSISVYM